MALPSPPSTLFIIAVAVVIFQSRHTAANCYSRNSMASAPSSAPTVGMLIDSVIAEVQNVTTTQLYATVITVSLAFAFFLINSGGGNPAALTSITEEDTSSAADSLKKNNMVVPRRAQTQRGVTSSTPEPKWHILKIMNYIIATGFTLSVLQFASNATTYLNDSTSLLQYLTIWSISLCYFFCFFGISFIDLDDLVADHQPTQMVQQQPVTQPRRSHQVER